MKKRGAWDDIPMSVESPFQLAIWLRRRHGVAAWLGNLILVLSLLQLFDVGGWWRSDDGACRHEPAAQQAVAITHVVVNVLDAVPPAAAGTVVRMPPMVTEIGRQMAALITTAGIAPLHVDVPSQTDRQIGVCPAISS